MVDLGSQLLDVVIALAFVFFLLSLISSGITEFLAAIFRLRASTLESALRQLLAHGKGGEGRREVAQGLLDHPLITTTAPGSRSVPSYLSARSFSLALLDTVAPPEQRDASQSLLEAVRGQLSQIPEPLARQLRPILDEAEGDVAAFRKGVETWFDDAMARVSGWYKRRSQWFVIGAAVLVTIVLNVSSVRVVDRLWNDDLVRASVANAAVGAVDEKDAAAAGGSSASTDDQALADAKAAGEQIGKAADELEALNLPIGWGEENDDWDNLATIGGWLITTLAIWIGAPFWFDTLKRLAPLRSTGPPPPTS